MTQVMTATREMFTAKEWLTLCSGGVVEVGGTRYRMCSACRSVIRVTGFLAGWHLCVPDGS